MSTHENDELASCCTQELHRRTDGLHGTPLGFDDVRGAATSIRRRRRVATGLAAVAAAVAVIVPTAMLATHGSNADGPPIAHPVAPVSDTNTPSPSSTPTMGADPHALDVTRPADGRSAAAHRLRRRHRPGPDQRAVVRRPRTAPSGRDRGQTFGPYRRAWHGIGPQPGRDGGRLGDRRRHGHGLGQMARRSRSC